jgi:outer membrane protein
MRRIRLAALLAGVLSPVPLSQGAMAADVPRPEAPIQAPSTPRFFLHLGPAGLVLDEGAQIFAANSRVPGGTIKIKEHMTFAVEAGYYLSPNIAVSFTGGLPPNVKIEAAGTMLGMGRVGATTYGPMTATVHYHFTDWGRFQPYIGAGPTFMYVFDQKDGIMSSLRVENAFGFAVQVGADYMLNDTWGVFVDVKKAILRTEGTGFLGPVPVKADIRLDPLVIHTGLTLRF